MENPVEDPDALSGNIGAIVAGIVLVLFLSVGVFSKVAQDFLVIEGVAIPLGERQFHLVSNKPREFIALFSSGHFCELLAEYWGFSGYRLAETVDSMYFDEPQTPVDPGSLLKDLNDNTKANYYLTVFFEGDQEGAPMYIQLHQFPGYVSLMVGTGHAVG